MSFSFKIKHLFLAISFLAIICTLFQCRRAQYLRNLSLVNWARSRGADIYFDSELSGELAFADRSEIVSRKVEDRCQSSIVGITGNDFLISTDSEAVEFHELLSIAAPEARVFVHFSPEVKLSTIKSFTRFPNMNADSSLNGKRLKRLIRKGKLIEQNKVSEQGTRNGPGDCVRVSDGLGIVQ